MVPREDHRTILWVKPPPLKRRNERINNKSKLKDQIYSSLAIARYKMTRYDYAHVLFF